MQHENTNQKKARVTILISGKLDFRTRAITKDNDNDKGYKSTNKQ